MACEKRLATGMELSEVRFPVGEPETAEMRDELDHPENEADVWLGQKTPVLLLANTVIIVVGSDSDDELEPIVAPVPFNDVVP